MSEPGDDTRREVQRLRRDVDRLAVESSETRRLAAMADRDGADLRARFDNQRGLLNALRATQVEHGKTLLEHGEALGGLTLQVAALDAKVDGLDTKVNGLDTKVNGLDTKVNGLGGILAEHSGILAEHSGILAEILRRLPDPTSGDRR